MGEYFATHETVAIAGIYETGEMDREHGHIESERNEDKTQDACEEVFDIHFLSIKKGSGMGTYGRDSEIPQKIP